MQYHQNLKLAMAITLSICLATAFAMRPEYISYGHRGRILSLAINEDHSLIASAGDDQEVFVWDFETKTILYRFKGHLVRVVKVAFLSGNRLCSIDQSGHIIVWSIESGEILFQWIGLKNTNTMSADIQERFLVTGMDNGTIRLFDLLKRHHIGDFEIHPTIIWSVAFSSGAKHIAIGTEDGRVILWDLNLRNIIKTSTLHTSRVWSTTFHPIDQTIVSGDWSGTVNFWQPSSESKQESISYNRPILKVKFNPSGSLLTIGTTSGYGKNQLTPTTRLVGYHFQKEILSFHQQNAHDIAITQDGKYFLAAGDQDGSIAWWSAENSMPLLSQPLDGQRFNSPEDISLSWDVDNLYSVVQVGRDRIFSNSVTSSVVDSNLNLQIGTDGKTLQLLPNEIFIDPSSIYWWRVKSGNFNRFSEWSQAQQFRVSSPLAGRVRISPSRQAVESGEDFTLAVWIESVDDLNSFQFDIQWTEPEAIHFITTTRFNEVFPKDAVIIDTKRFQLQQDNEPLRDEPFFQIDRQKGVYKNIVAIKDSKYAAKTTGRLIQILCRAKKKGTYQFSIENFSFLTQSLNEIAVEINPAEVIVGEGFQNWDVNLDNIVDIFDLSIVALYYGKKVPWDYNPDVNRDSEVDLFDLVLISSHFGQSYQSTNFWAESFAPSRPDLSRTTLENNYPNPFSIETWIPFQLANPANVHIQVYSSTGQLVRNLSLGQISSGHYIDKRGAAHWDRRNSEGELVPSGIYFYTLTTNGWPTEKIYSQTKKMVVIH